MQPAVPLVTQKIGGNNGTVSCTRYCGGVNGGPWNNMLPVSWQGAKCVSAAIGTCDTVAGLITTGGGDTSCVCTPDPNKKGWAQ